MKDAFSTRLLRIQDWEYRTLARGEEELTHDDNEFFLYIFGVNFK